MGGIIHRKGLIVPCPRIKMWYRLGARRCARAMHPCMHACRLSYGHVRLCRVLYPRYCMLYTVYSVLYTEHVCVYFNLQICMSMWIRLCICTVYCTCNVYIPTCLPTCLHTYMHTYLHTCIHTYIHTYNLPSICLSSDTRWYHMT